MDIVVSQGGSDVFENRVQVPLLVPLGLRRRSKTLTLTRCTSSSSVSRPFCCRCFLTELF